ncbi:MAG: YegS/Rv2252/BmrU family lipid kinase [Acidobacteriota bacterium]
MSVAVIINPVSGGAPPGTAGVRAAAAAAILERHGEIAEVSITERPGHAYDLAQAAVRRGARLVIAWGGDGTINEAASALAFGDVPLGIVPAGSGNGLAAELGVDRRPELAIARAVRATPSRIDLGALGGRLFVNLAGIGIDAHVASQFNLPANVGRGFINYLRLGVRAVFSYAPAWYTITTGGVRLRVRAVLVVVANAVQYGNGAKIAPGARVDDGELDLVVVEERWRIATVCRTPRLFTGSLARAGGCSIRRIREATIECEEPMAFHVDGEPIAGATRLDARVHPGALRVCI